MKLLHWLPRFLGCGLATVVLLVSQCSAELVNVMVTIENLVPANGVSFAPLRIGFGNGSFDAFNINETATAAIVSVAEGGSGSDWFPAFSSGEPNAVLGSVGGALTPGATASNSFMVNSAVNPFFTFASMVIPSNDLFIGNDDPQEYQVLDPLGNLLINSILVKGFEVWDANSEVADPLNAAFVVGGVNGNRTPENGTVALDFSELFAFNGLQTAAGYFYDHSLLSGDSDLYRISFSVSSVPEPTSLALAMVAGIFASFRRRRVS